MCVVYTCTYTGSLYYVRVRIYLAYICMIDMYVCSIICTCTCTRGVHVWVVCTCTRGVHVWVVCTCNKSSTYVYVYEYYVRVCIRVVWTCTSNTYFSARMCEICACTCMLYTCMSGMYVYTDEQYTAPLQVECVHASSMCTCMSVMYVYEKSVRVRLRVLCTCMCMNVHMYKW